VQVYGFCIRRAYVAFSSVRDYMYGRSSITERPYFLGNIAAVPGKSVACEQANGNDTGTA